MVSVPREVAFSGSDCEFVESQSFSLSRRRQALFIEKSRRHAIFQEITNLEEKRSGKKRNCYERSFVWKRCTKKGGMPNWKKRERVACCERWRYQHCEWILKSGHGGRPLFC